MQPLKSSSSLTGSHHQSPKPCNASDKALVTGRHIILRANTEHETTLPLPVVRSGLLSQNQLHQPPRPAAKPHSTNHNVIVSSQVRNFDKQLRIPRRFKQSLSF